MITRLAANVGIALIVAFVPILTEAATYEWTGGSTTSNNWSDAANWIGGVPVSDATNSVVFTSAGNQAAASPNSFQNLSPNPFQLAALTFSFAGSGSFSLGGGALSSSTLGLTQNSAFEVSVANSLTGSAGINIGGNGTGILRLQGNVSSGGSPLTKGGTSTVEVTGNSSLYSLAVDGGTFSVTAGQQSISRTLTVGTQAGTNGVFNLSGGTVLANNGERVGGSGTGTVNQSGGSNSSSFMLMIDSNGTYNLTGGTLSTSVSIASNGKYQQSGGSSSQSQLSIAGGGSATVSGGTLDAAVMTVGDSSASTAALTINGGGIVSAQFGLNLQPNAVVTVSGGAKLNVNQLTNSTGGNPLLSISDPSGGGSSALTIGTLSSSHSATFSGTIANGLGGSGSVLVQGSGQMIFNGTNTYTGVTDVRTGLIGGTGTIAGPVTLSSGATISPGLLSITGPNDPFTGVGQFQLGSLTMASGTTYQASINGFAPGQFDVLSVTSGVTLNGPTLSLRLNFTAAPGDTFVILLLAGTTQIAGEFVNARDGSLITANNNQIFAVDYQGGDGNDLSLRAIPEPSAVALGGIAAVGFGLAAMRRYWRRFDSRAA